MTLEIFYKTLSEIHTLNCVRGLLDWDQQVNMPPAESAGRARQTELVSVLVHQRYTEPKFTTVVDRLADSIEKLGDDDRVNVREIKRIVDRLRKLPEEFVAERARVSALAYGEWLKAREAADFKLILPWLEKIIALERRAADYLGYQGHPYSALLEEYEPYLRFEEAKPALLKLADALKVLIPQIESALPETPPPSGFYPKEPQKQLCAKVASDLGFRFDRGRLDETVHPFSSAIGVNDVRITTRFDLGDYLSSLLAAIHEAGHAIYEQDLPQEWRIAPLGWGVSTALHESQSRLWENIVGRSRSFAAYLHGLLNQFFPEEIKNRSAEDLWYQLNRVKRGVLRLEADEATYNLHIVIRTLLEERLVGGDLLVKDLPEAWNELYERYLGVRPPSDTTGVLQDVHWYTGLVGYFPTYALGNLYGAAFMKAAHGDLEHLDEEIKRGDFRALREWLKKNVYQHGMRYRALELLQKVTGQGLSEEPFLAYLQRKFLETSSAGR